MIRITPRCVWLLPLTAALTALGTSGCAGLGIGELSLFGSASGAAAAAKSDAAAESLPKYYVEFHPDGGKPMRMEGTLDETMYVQGALEKTRAMKRFGKVNVFVVRTNQDSDRKHRMDVTYDSAKRRVTPETDYALHPGDRIVVVEDSSSLVDKLMGPALGPLGALGGR